MDTVKLQVEERELTGDGPARRLRAQGRLPGVLYGKGTEPQPVSLDAEELVAATLREMSKVQPDPHAFLVAAGKALTITLSGEYHRLKTILARIRQ